MAINETLTCVATVQNMDIHPSSQGQGGAGGAETIPAATGDSGVHPEQSPARRRATSGPLAESKSERSAKFIVLVSFAIRAGFTEHVMKTQRLKKKCTA